MSMRRYYLGKLWGFRVAVFKLYLYIYDVYEDITRAMKVMEEF